MTTLSPGVCANHASRLCECWPAAPVPEPPGARSTIGTCAAPPSMKWIFAAWLTIWSIAWQVKSLNWISATGRRPAIAIPTAAPTKPSSEIGVSRTRSPPKRAKRSPETPNAPP
jgi:hypothetical protein